MQNDQSGKKGSVSANRHQNRRVALVHEFLTQFGGAEQVLLAILELFPKAMIHTLVYDRAKLGRWFSKYRIKTSFIQTLPLAVKKYKWYLPLMPRAIESFRFDSYDLVISDSSAFAKGIIVPTPTFHISYIHTPTRYLWQEEKFYLATAGIPWIIQPIVRHFLARLKQWDRLAAERPNLLIANSKTVHDRIKRFYHRDSLILHPFVNRERFYISPTVRDFFLVTGRIVPYKRFDIVIEAFNQLKLPLVVAGDGYGLPTLKRLARSSKITFLGRVSDRQLAKLYAECQAYIFPAHEDFGITPLEAMASGRPVIAYHQGGATETVVDGQTGIFFNEQTAVSLVKAIKRFLTSHDRFQPSQIRQHSVKWSKKNFQKQFITILNQGLDQWNSRTT